jgi:hypothetical protein
VNLFGAVHGHDALDVILGKECRVSSANEGGVGSQDDPAVLAWPFESVFEIDDVSDLFEEKRGFPAGDMDDLGTIRFGVGEEELDDLGEPIVRRWLRLRCKYIGYDFAIRT